MTQSECNGRKTYRQPTTCRSCESPWQERIEPCEHPGTPKFLAKSGKEKTDQRQVHQQIPRTPDQRLSIDHLFSFGSQLLRQLVFLIMATGVSVSIAVVSWHLYEKQFLKLKRLVPYQSRDEPISRNIPAEQVSRSVEK